MNEKDTLNLIEKLNKDYIDITNSKEYTLGKRIIELKNSLKHFEFIKIFKKFIVHQKIKKYYKANSSNLSNNIINKKISGKKIAVYTCVTGGYDKISEPLYDSPYCDYYLITDDKNMKPKKWKKILIPEDIKKQYDNNGTIINRYYKLNPQEIFKEYDYSIYIDGNVQIISDLSFMINNVDPSVGIAIHKHRDRECICDELEACKILKKGNSEKLKQQVDRYLDENFPKHYGMGECAIIVTNLKNKQAVDILNAWWIEFQKSESLRDQIALPYILWKKNILMEKITTLGENYRVNPKVREANIHKG
jgi:hypothetical protein